MAPTSRLTDAQRRGRTAGTVVFAVLIVVPTLHWSRQILVQAWDPPQRGAVTEGCRPGIASLIEAVTRARTSAAAEAGGEIASVTRFRRELAPEWDARPALDSACADDPRARALLHEVDLLRYAEERTARLDAFDVARRRRRVRRLAHDIGLEPPVSLEMPAGRD
jgi:hypothetical protein